MGIPFGTQLGSYQITSLLGKGGMGEVYRARDTKLGREVAVKALPDGFLHDAERLARFEREAQALASLNHPNIAIIHELKESAGSKYIILELIEGETLAERIARGRLPLDETLDIARQIAEALEAAHEKGVVHRDLKPANVKVTPEGRVKILDFGLAKIHETGNATQNLSESPTLSAMQTGGGVILGTVAYMSPEQARGKTVDRRTDVWAFGCILYEMLTGRHTFPNGETASDTIAGILAREPDWQALPSTTPAKIRTLLERCLRKDVRRRLPDIAEARIEMEEARTEHATTTVRPAAPVVSRRREVILIGLVILLLLAATAFGVRSWLAPKLEIPVVRFEVSSPTNATFPDNPFLQFSPDGRKLAFLALSPGIGPRVFVRSIDAASASALAGTEGINNVFFWSADSQYIAFITPGKLNKIAVAGGPVQLVCNLPAGGYAGGTWNAEGVILLGRGAQAGPLLRVAAAGGEPTAATELDGPRKETRHAYPNFLPDGRHFLYVSEVAGPADRVAYVGSLDSKERHPLPGVASEVKYSSTGHLVFARNSSLMAQPFDIRRLELSGEAFPITELGVPPTALTGPYTASLSGGLAYRAGPPAANSQNTQLAWFDRKGKQLSLVGPPGEYSRISLSPDGKSIAFERGSPSDIWVMDVQRGIASRLVSNPAADLYPTWSADSKSIVFASDRGGPALYERQVDVVGEEKLLLKTDVLMGPTDWSQGGFIAYNSPGGPAVSELFALPLSGDRKPIRLVDSPGKMAGRISADGHWIAYLSNESPGNQPFQVFIQSFPQPGLKKQVSTDGAFQQRWSRDGKELFYLSPDISIMAVSFKSNGASLEIGTPVALFRAPINTGGFTTGRDYDLAPDGRFLINVAQSASPAALSAPITVILNWAAPFKK